MDLILLLNNVMKSQLIKPISETEMRILSLPTVVQREIFGHFKLEELLFLSFCSKRFKYLIQSIQGHRLKQIETITYTFSRGKFSIGAGTLFHLTLYEGYSCITPMELFGMSRETPCCWNRSPSCSLYNYDGKRRDSIIQGVHSYIQQFFGPSTYYEIESFNELPTSLENIRRSYIFLPDNSKPKELEACFKKSPIQQYVWLEGRLNGNLSSNSVIYKTEYLEVDHFRIGDFLIHFKGDYLRCNHTSLDNTEIVEFLNAWKSNERCKNLKVLTIYSMFDLDKNEILGKVGHKSLNPWEFVEWDIRDDNGGDNITTTTTRDYLIRESDGKRAYVNITPKVVYLAVFGSTGNYIKF
ncbi:hypothetical protein GCK72_017866 [Caenorhabditis remanei]|uniref:F-box domain-containing protein n=1 Tax=Caenorhabditis remanei TaxID=31234 RepID=A0A6A5G9U3_CAERE|nr:hypothetical protein GCK72_017866 [Caenorhabditis remanei]KAF1751312.1 hypothetical protein GCK72_017866 [Caenorhabditis remanei]